MAKLTYSNASNAVRGFRQVFPDLGARLDNVMIRADFIDGNRDGSYTINLEAVADYQQELLGVVTTSTLVGVPVLRRSVSGGVVGRALQLYRSLPAGTARRDAIAQAVAQGVAFYTARTQYQRFATFG